MSARIGEVPKHGSRDNRVVVSASGGGVEVHSDEELRLEPVEARNYAALLVRATEEVERMRREIDWRSRNLGFHER